MLSRRRFLIAGTLLSAGAVYAYQRGLRYPRLSLEPGALAERLTLPSATFELHDVIELRGHDTLAFRAIAPEPTLAINTQRGKIEFLVNNIAQNAQLEVSGKGIKLLGEKIEGITRKLTLESGVEQTLRLDWRLPNNGGLDFAVMGDTGGGAELSWTIERATELDAQFLLHLGDFNYQEGEYTNAIKQFLNAPIPCYISIGNHDFHDNGLIYQRFLDQLGPLNHSFSIAGTRFTNIDTAADFFPASGGLRGAMVQQLQQHNHRGEQVFFTHRPLKDPRPHDDHEVGGINEIDWLTDMLNSVGCKQLLTGHVHHSAELEFEGIHQYTIGEGLGFEDLVLQRPVAKIMMGRVEEGRSLAHSWVDLNMPWSEHTSPTHAFKLKKFGRLKQLEWYQSLILNDTTT